MARGDVKRCGLSAAERDRLPDLPAWKLERFLQMAPRRCESGMIAWRKRDCLNCGAIEGEPCQRIDAAKLQAFLSKPYDGGSDNHGS